MRGITNSDRESWKKHEIVIEKRQQEEQLEVDESCKQSSSKREQVG